MPFAIASDDVVAGVREELARAGALAPGEGFPCAEIEVLRNDDESVGVVARGGQPAARGIGVSIRGRAWVTPEAGAPPEGDTGDVSAADVIAVDESAGAVDPLGNAFHEDDALRAIARRLGRRLGRLLLGSPTARESP